MSHNTTNSETPKTPETPETPETDFPLYYTFNDLLTKDEVTKLIKLLTLQSDQKELEKKMSNKIFLNESIDDVKLDLTCNAILQHLIKTEK